MQVACLVVSNVSLGAVHARLPLLWQQADNKSCLQDRGGQTPPPSPRLHISRVHSNVWARLRKAAAAVTT